MISEALNFHWHLLWSVTAFSSSFPPPRCAASPEPPLQPHLQRKLNLGFAIIKVKFGIHTVRKDSGHLVQCSVSPQSHCMMVHKSLRPSVPQLPCCGQGWHSLISGEQEILITAHKMLKCGSINSKQVFSAFLKITHLQTLRSIAQNGELPWLLRNCSRLFLFFFKEWVGFITVVIS